MTVIDEYLKNVEEPQKSELDRIRKIVKQTTPDVKEAISYGVPTLKYKGKNLIHFAAFKNHMSLFPGPKLIELFDKKLVGYKTAKGTVQFTTKNPLPDSLILEMVRIRILEIDG